MAGLFLLQAATARAQSPTLQWDENSSSVVTGYAVTVDGVRTDYGLTPRKSDGTCACSIPLPFTSGKHTTIVIAYNTKGETASQPLVNGPTANAGGPYAVQAGATLTVTGASSTVIGGTITKYAWNWGDGSTVTQSASPSGTHTYAAPGTFTLTLTVTDSLQVTSSATTTVTVSGGTALPGAPGSPSPSSGATGVSTAPTLTWAASGATGYDVQFGTSNPPPAAASNLTTASYKPATLTANTTYFWRVVARNSAGTTTGSVWSFTTTGTTPTAPASPNPSSGATGVSTAPTLTWTASGATSYDVQFGTANPPAAAASNLTTASYTPATLTANTTYFWRVVARNSSGTTTGSVWSFTTSASSPTAPSSPNPASGATGMSTAPTLTWTSSGATSYDVQFGTTNPPTAAASNLTTASYKPATLTASTTYFWRVVARNSSGTTTGAVWSFQTASATSTAPDVVIYAGDIASGQIHGTWSKQSDGSAASGVKLASPDQGLPKLSTPLANPANYVDVPFNAQAGKPYALWIRLRATNNLPQNDSLWVQFSDATSGGGSLYPINSTSGLAVALATDDTGNSINGWGWQNGAYWAAQPTTFTFASSGAHTLRVQVREDGVQFDQIVLSPSTYLTASPGSTTADTTIVPQSGVPGTPMATSPTDGATGVTTTPTLSWTSSGATSYDVQFGTTNPPPTVSSGQTSTAYTTPALTAGATYFWRIVARNSSGTATGAVWSFQTASATSTAPDVVIYAGDIASGQIHGTWSKQSSGNAAGGVKLVSLDLGQPKVSTPLANPANYVDVPFNAQAGKPYALWIRLRAANNLPQNDSLWVQFSDATSGGVPRYPINSTSGLAVALATDDTGSSIGGWGWQNGAYWVSQPTTFTFASSGAHTLRIQVREDGVQFDQIVLSPATYLTTSPGSTTADQTIVPK